MWLRAVGFRFLAYALTAYAAAGAFLYFRQSALMFPAPKAWAKVSPASCDLQFEDLQIPVTSASHVHAWWMPAGVRSEKVILAFHGNGYVLEDMVGEELIALHESDANVLVIDYRGYGLSTHINPDELSILQDARAALEFLLRKRNVPVRNVFVLGRSIGSGPATQLAYETKGLGGLILESPFSSIDAVTTNFWLFRLYPVRLLLRTHFDNLSKIDAIRTPLLVVAGTADTLTPVGMARAIFAKARPPKELYLVKGADHNNLLSLGGNPLKVVLRNFVQQTDHLERTLSEVL